MWKWDQQEPFGVNVPDENPSGLGAFEFPMRFPGQYADKETGDFYNYFRDAYDAELGRYTQSDPIGLQGGLNSYAYAELAPTFEIDEKGLIARPPKIPTLPNGNVTDGFTPQDYVCTDPASSLNRNPCTKQCCVTHDKCYDKYRCNASSWMGNIGGAGKQCQKCNSDARNCILANFFRKDCPPGVCRPND